MRAACDDVEVERVEVNGENNHVHLLVDFPPKLAPSRLVNSLKGVLSRGLRQEFPDLRQHYWGAQRRGPGRTSPGRSAARRCRSCGTTSSSRNVLSRARSPAARIPARAFTTALKGGALARIPAAPAGPAAGIRPVRSGPARPRRCSPMVFGTVSAATRTTSLHLFV